MTETLPVTLTVNGTTHHVTVPPNRILADLLREDLGLSGCKIGCDQAACGACTVLVDGLPVTGCTSFVFELDGKAITTIEGVASGPGVSGLSPVQRSFVDKSGFQCGFCTPGMVLSVTALLAHHPDPDETTIRQWLSANICRCTGYGMIIDAVKAAAAATKAGAA